MRSWQICLIATNVIVDWKGWPSMPSAIVCWYARFAIRSACIDPEDLMSIDFAYMCDNMSPPWSRAKGLVFLTLLAVTRMVLWVTQTESIVQNKIDWIL